MSEQFEAKPTHLSPEKIKAAHRKTIQVAITDGFEGLRNFILDIETHTGKPLRIGEKEFLLHSIEKFGGSDQVISDEGVLASVILKNEAFGKNWNQLQEYLSSIFDPELARRIVMKAQDMQKRMLGQMSGAQRFTPLGRR